MKRQQAEAVLNRFFEECGEAVPAQSDIEPVLDRVWERLEWKADEFVAARATAPPTQSFRFAWAVGMVLVAVLVSGVVWRQGPPFSVAVRTANEDSLARLSTQQAGEILAVTVPPDAFDVASVKLLSPSSEAFKKAQTGEEFNAAFTGCSGGYRASALIDPGRLTIPSSLMVGLIVTAYGQECKHIEGGPAWARSGEFYEINAILPAGTPSYTVQDFAKGNAPVVQRMLQNLLANRFRLVLKREFREMPVYALVVAKPGKMKLSTDAAPPAPAAFPVFPGMPTPQLRRGQLMGSASLLTGEVHSFGHAISMSDLSESLRPYAARWVVDKTGLTDLFDVELKFASEVPMPTLPGRPPAPPVAPTPQAIPPVPVASLRSALEELGLRLEPTRLPVEVLIIQSVERPSEN